MKPEKPKLIKYEWVVANADAHEAIDMITAEHYAPFNADEGQTIPYAYVHGLYHIETEILFGVVWWRPPMPNCKQSVAQQCGVDPDRVLELSRVAIVPEAPVNAASFLISGSIALIHSDRYFQALVSFADTLRGHEGKIYQATNWTSVGLTKPEWIWGDPRTADPDDPEDRLKWKQVPRKKNNRTRTVEEMRALGYELIGKSQKHKYVICL